MGYVHKNAAIRCLLGGPKDAHSGGTLSPYYTVYEERGLLSYVLKWSVLIISTACFRVEVGRGERKGGMAWKVDEKWWLLRWIVGFVEYKHEDAL